MHRLAFKTPQFILHKPVYEGQHPSKRKLAVALCLDTVLCLPTVIRNYLVVDSPSPLIERETLSPLKLKIWDLYFFLLNEMLSKDNPLNVYTTTHVVQQKSNLW